MKSSNDISTPLNLRWTK